MCRPCSHNTFLFTHKLARQSTIGVSLLLLTNFSSDSGSSPHISPPVLQRQGEKPVCRLFLFLWSSGVLFLVCRCLAWLSRPMNNGAKKPSMLTSGNNQQKLNEKWVYYWYKYKVCDAASGPSRRVSDAEKGNIHLQIISKEAACDNLLKAF